MVRVLYLGRFNPPHLGHFEALKYIFNLDNVDSVLIGIGSAQDSFSLKNPLTGGERFQIIENLLGNFSEFESKKYFIIPLLDLNNNNLYPRVQSLYKRRVDDICFKHLSGYSFLLRCAT